MTDLKATLPTPPPEYHPAFLADEKDPVYGLTDEKDPVYATTAQLTSAEKADLQRSSASVYSDTTAVNALGTLANTPFTAGRALAINARGIRAIRLPVPSNELTITVTHNHPDGELAYISQRAKRCSGNCVLSSPGRGDLVATQYKFGPGREPNMIMLSAALVAGSTDIAGEKAAQMTDAVIVGFDGETETVRGVEVGTKGKWTSRSQAFTMPDGRAFEWRYVKDKFAPVAPVAEEKKVAKETRLVLREVSSGKTIAMLVRNDETRTPGTSKCGAGNGGLLVLDVDAAQVLDEAMVVASCILMLKKEIDRRRAIQFMVIAGAASGGP